MFTVKQYIELLSKMPQDAIIVSDNGNNGYHGRIFAPHQEPRFTHITNVDLVWDVYANEKTLRDVDKMVVINHKKVEHL